MNPWNVRVGIDPTRTLLLVTDPGGDLLKASLPSRTEHPRALLTLLEGLALWSGSSPLCAATSVAPAVPPSVVTAVLGGDFWPTESPLVRMAILEPPLRRRRIAGVGDFRPLQRLPGGAR